VSTKRMARWTPSLHSHKSARPTTIRWRFHRRRIFYWCSRTLSISTSVASKATRWLGKKYRQVFVQNYFHCIATIPGDKVPRPLGTQLNATKPSEILHFDYLYTGLSRDGKFQYLLLLKNDLSAYLWLVPCRTADAAATVDALMRWFAAFGVVLL
jgi:hypothetical protein